jgi:phosphatidyl-myo-inositol dimannoside synthase
MRVLFLTTELADIGGVQYAGRLLLRGLDDVFENRADFTILSLRDSLAKLQGLKLPGRAIGFDGNRCRLLWHSFRLRKSSKWDLLVLGHINLGAVPLLISGSCSRSLAFVYGVEAWRPLRGTRRLGLRKMDRLLYISEHTRKLSHQFNPWLMEQPSGICHLGLLPEEKLSDADLSDPRVLEHSESAFVLTVGRMSAAERYKGHEELIRVWPRVLEDRPDLRLVFVGDGDDRPRLEELARPQGDKVQFLRVVDDATRNRLLRSCRCFCLPSRGEGFGLVYLEAMRLGKPVLAGRDDAGKEVVLDGVTGRTVDPKDPEMLRRGILDVTGPRAPSMGAEGRRRFLDHFDYPAFLKRLRSQMDLLMADRAIATATG